MAKKIRVWIADCHGLTGAGLQALLERHTGIEVLGVAGHNRQCAGDYHRYKPDVAIMDMTLKGTCCLDAMRHILAHDPRAKILVISVHTDGITASRVMNMGAKGYLSLESTPDMLISAVQNIALGGIYIQPEMTMQLLENNAGGSRNPFDILSKKEFEVFLMIVGGQSVNEISESMSLSRSTVANHHTHILHKLAVSNHVDLTKLAIRHAIIEA